MTRTDPRARWAAPNAEAIEAWDGPLFDGFLRFRHLITTGVAPHSERALELVPPQPGWRVLDIGCGFGDTTQRIAALVGPDGEAVGVDAAANFIDAARADAAQAGVANARFEVADVQGAALGGPFDLAFSRFGTMFFASPVAALRNVRAALVPGGRLAMVVWRRREDNPWTYRAQTIVESIVARPDESDEPTCGPGPFSMANADTTSDIVLAAGFEDVALHRCERPVTAGRDLQEAVDLVMALGPGGEILRLLGDRGADVRPRVEAALREGLSEFVEPDGAVRAQASTWIVSACAPGAR
jgi:SAM-dependent methyltransferase